VINEEEDNPNLYTTVIICSEVKLLLMRLSNLFLEDVLVMARFNNSALKDPSAKGIPFCSAMIRSIVRYDN
jgi:hypothetical protein